MYPTIHQQLVTNIEVPLAQAFTYDYWATGGDLNTLDNLHKELLQRLRLEGDDKEIDIRSRAYMDEISHFTKINNLMAGSDSVWDLPLAARQSLLEEWESLIDRTETTAKLCNIHEQHKRLQQAKRSVRGEREISTMQEASIVGMTTTACAARREQLAKVGFEILICEEAGEVLEAHALCAMLPSLKHAINIGDPLQLRPEAEEQSLVMETNQGRQYRLNESLFERIMQPVDPMSKTVATTGLHIQRRMHPSISDLSRITYPYLQDHPDTWSYPVPKGLRQHVVWLDHTEPEDETNDVSKSASNKHEVGMVKELVAYLLRGSDYSAGDIAVLTPYSGQLVKLKAALSDVCAVYLVEEDRDALVESGALEADHEELIERGKTHVPMHALLRLATIDNFQGEEAKVIILSTVRSGDKLGFVKSPNRINVAMSRARDGMYVFGNSSALRTDPIWNAIVNMFIAKQALQSSIRLQCDRHTQHHRLAATANDIATFPICNVRCNQALACGHICVETCHDPSLHQLIPCTWPCNRQRQCGHICEALCGEPCPPCATPRNRQLQPCGHMVLVTCTGQLLPCDHFEGYFDLNCGKHAVGYSCGDGPPSVICEERCSVQLACGHRCPGICGQCVVNEYHNVCTATCNTLLGCGHECDAICHDGIPCPICTQVCQPACQHEQSTHRCNDEIPACLESVQICSADDQEHDVACALTARTSTSIELLRHEEALNIVNPAVHVIRQQLKEAETVVEKSKRMLEQTSTMFLMQALQAGTLAAGKNIQHWFARQHDVTGDADRAIARSKKMFHALVDGLCLIMPDCNVTAAGFDTSIYAELNKLEISAANARASDTLTTARYLLTLPDPSKQMQRTAYGLLAAAKVELTLLLERTGYKDGDEHDQVIAETRRICEGILKEIANRLSELVVQER